MMLVIITIFVYLTPTVNTYYQQIMPIMDQFYTFMCPIRPRLAKKISPNKKKMTPNLVQTLAQKYTVL